MTPLSALDICDSLVISTEQFGNKDAKAPRGSFELIIPINHCQNVFSKNNFYYGTIVYH